MSMRWGVLFVVTCLMATCASAGVTITKVLPEGDGNIGKSRPGYGWSYEWDAWQTDANPNPVYHWYEYGAGAYRDTFLQVGLGGLPAAGDITGASLNIYMVRNGDDGDGLLATVRHAADSSTADGNASQRIAGSETVGTITTADSLGWLSFDVTSFIQNDVTNGYSWAAFQFVNDGYSSMYFASGEDAVYAPYLAVESASAAPSDMPAVPVPSSLGLALMGGLALWRKRRP
ncbi:MAG: DNRLRE domain-containing protein [Sedimentisphaerales bacterium]|nr:DNRLRE domain-containing protein [Sedimentisphaerales bacterium]